jgi:hypothetical protein
LAAGFIKEVFHPEWLANLVLVKKKGEKWRMCVDYTGLNKACPKVPYPLPHINQIVDSTAGCETLSFLDAYSGYHQIKMKESDQLATSFITPFGIEANPEKIAAITNMGPIKDLKGVQRVMGCLATLSRFISHLGERGLPLYRLLRKAKRFTWTPEAEEALRNLKALLTDAPILVPPAAGEAILIYVAATTQVVNAAIIVER